MKIFYKINQDGTVARGSGTAVPDGFNIDFSLIQLDEDGNFYKFYNQDGTPDIDKCNTKSLEDLVEAGEVVVKQYVQDVVNDYNKTHNIKFENVYNCAVYKDIDDYEHQQFCIDVLAFNAAVWQKAREIQVDIVEGNIETPTDEEFRNMLPAYDGVM